MEKIGENEMAVKKYRAAKCPKCSKVIKGSGRYLGGKPYHDKCYKAKIKK